MPNCATNSPNCRCCPRSARRPLLIVHNKYNDEWGEGAINHIGLDSLRIILTMLGTAYTIVYIRHGMSAEAHDFIGDHNVPLSFDGRRLLDDYPEVLCFDDLYAAHRAQGSEQTMNAFKNVLYSRCHRFISSQGGGTYQMAQYSGSLVVILHRRGAEEHWAYGKGHFRFMATVPPLLAVCRTEDDRLRALPLFLGSTVVDDRVFPAPGGETLLAELSPLKIARRRS